jgi:hypothetical protein
MRTQEGIYELTRAGRQVAGRVTPGSRDELLDYMYRGGKRLGVGGSRVERTYTFSELEVATGVEGPKLRVMLSRYIPRYVREVGAGGD